MAVQFRHRGIGRVSQPRANLVGKDKALAQALLVVHQTLNLTLALVVAAHVGAAIKHQWIDRDGVMARMLPRRRAS